jgi:hypothetical protein
MTAECELDKLKFALALILSPSKLPCLLRFGKQVTAASDQLGKFLTAIDLSS